jgi:hypothetical protein
VVKTGATEPQVRNAPMIIEQDKTEPENFDLTHYEYQMDPADLERDEEEPEVLPNVNIDGIDLAYLKDEDPFYRNKFIIDGNYEPAGTDMGDDDDAYLLQWLQRLAVFE